MWQRFRLALFPCARAPSALDLMMARRVAWLLLALAPCGALVGPRSRAALPSRVVRGGGAGLRMSLVEPESVVVMMNGLPGN